jgi:hypothetical protein
MIASPGTDFSGSVAAGPDAFYATANLGADIGGSVDGTPIQGAPNPRGLLVKLQP